MTLSCFFNSCTKVLADSFVIFIILLFLYYELMSFRTFVETGSSYVELSVPQPYRILSAGVTLHGYAVLTASYPRSTTTWVAKTTPLHRDAQISLQVIAIKESHFSLSTHVVEKKGKGNVMLTLQEASEKVWPSTGEVQTGKTDSSPGLHGADIQSAHSEFTESPTVSSLVALCGGFQITHSCVTSSSAVFDNASLTPTSDFTPMTGWCVDAEHPEAEVNCYLLVAEDCPSHSINVGVTPRGVWRIHIEGVGESVSYFGSCKGQNPIARSTLLTPPSAYSVSHPRKATPALWKLHRQPPPVEKIRDMSLAYCKMTKRMPGRSS